MIYSDEVKAQYTAMFAKLAVAASAKAAQLAAREAADDARQALEQTPAEIGAFDVYALRLTRKHLEVKLMKQLAE